MTGQLQVLAYNYVTIYEKTRHMGFFVKVEFDVWLISCTIGANSRSSFRPIVRFIVEISALFAIAPHPK